MTPAGQRWTRILFVLLAIGCSREESHERELNYTVASEFIYNDNRVVECRMYFPGYEIRFKPDEFGICHAPMITVHK